MIVISATDTFFEWTMVFLESLYITNGDEHKVCLNGLDLSSDMIEKLKKVYPNIEIDNEMINKKAIMKEFDVKGSKFDKAKKQLADGFKKENRWFSQYVLQKRTQGLQRVMKEHPNEDWFVLYDVDFMFRKSIKPMIKLVKDHDVTLRFRPSLKVVKEGGPKKDFMRVSGGVSGFSGNKGREFVDKWNEILVSKDIRKLPVDVYIWDQAAMYKTFLHYENDMNWGEFDVGWISAGYHYWKPVWGGHRKASNIYVEIGDDKKENIKVYNCHTRTKLRNIIFTPELERLRKEQIEKDVPWAGNIQKETHSEQLRKKWEKSEEERKKRKEAQKNKTVLQKRKESRAKMRRGR